MVRSLVIRQAVRVADYVLVVLLGVVIYQVIVLMMGLDNDAGGSISETEAPDVNFQVASVGDRSEYDAIVNAQLFGPAGDLEKSAPPAEVVEEEDPATETELPLQLLGASATVGLPTDPSASAFIRNPAARTVQKDGTYWVADEIMEGVTLLEVYPRRVQIRNNGKLEWLSMSENKPQPNAMAARQQFRNMPRPARPASPGNVRDAKMVQLDREETIQEMMSMDYAETIRQLRPQMKYDENNNVVGITSDYFSEIPLAEKTGFIDGDVITEVNGTPIDSQESVPDILIKEQNATSVRIRFERDGRSMVRTIRLE